MMKRESSSVKIASMVLAASIAAWAGGCASNTANNASSSPATAEAGGCKIDPVKICEASSGRHASTAPMPSAPTMGMYGSRAIPPETVQFEVPLGPTIQVMCYYDPQHATVSRADIANQPALTPDTVKYLRDHHFCAAS
ncbi:MAG TPA: hypothetical protein VIX59_02660 [Candidatus Binataceae bacterium]